MALFSDFAFASVLVGMDSFTVGVGRRVSSVERMLFLIVTV
jgi:hypothetical protein